MDCPSEANLFQIEQACLIGNNYRYFLGKALIPEAHSEKDFARLLFYAPFAVLSHDSAADPFFNYANRKGLELFELSWQELCVLPSRLSAEPLNQIDRERLLAEVKKKGYIDNYQGIRIAKSGKRFSIKNTEVWNLYDANNGFKGQAACIRQWQFL